MWKELAQDRKLALVLAGGGARGAYELGAVEALAETGFEPDFVAGTSIGALNGSMIAQETDIRDAAARLASAWERLGKESVIVPDFNAHLQNASLVAAALRKDPKRLVASAVSKYGGQERGYLSTAPMESLLQDLVDPSRLRTGRSFWVALTKLLSNTSYPFRHIVAPARAWSSKDVEYVRPAALSSDEDLYAALMGSAAIPIAFPSRSVGGSSYFDGGIVDNVPVEAIRDQGCGLVVVVHLSNGSLWDRRQFGDLTVLELRPSQPVQELSGPAGWLLSVLDFRPRTIDRLRTLGRDDTRERLKSLGRSTNLLTSANKARRELLDTTARLLDDEPLFDD